MLKNLFLFLLISLAGTWAMAQVSLEKGSYFMMAPDDLFKIQIDKDILSITQCSYDLNCALNAKYQYKILETVNRDSFLVLYVETLKHLSGNWIRPDRFQILAINYSEDRNTLHLINEINFFNSLSESKLQDISNLPSKFSFTYFSLGQLKIFRDYTSPFSLGSEQIKNLITGMRQEALAIRSKVINTKTGDLYGTVTAREVINRSLIKLKINPFYKNEDLDYLFKAQK